MISWLVTASFVQLLLWFAAFVWIWTVLALVAGFLLETSAFGRAHKILDLPLKPGQLKREALNNFVFNGVAMVCLAAVVKSGILPMAPFSWSASLGTFTYLFFIFPIYYYGMHRAMHTPALVRFHREHHYSQVTTPLTGMSMGVVEMLGWNVGFVLPMCILAAFGPVSYEGWLAYLAFNWFGNAFGHANVEIGPAYYVKRGVSWVSPPFTYHVLHHARFQNHYGFASSLCDELFGTVWEDWRRVFLKTRAGEPLKKLSERA